MFSPHCSEERYGWLVIRLLGSQCQSRCGESVETANYVTNQLVIGNGRKLTARELVWSSAGADTTHDCRNRVQDNLQVLGDAPGPDVLGVELYSVIVRSVIPARGLP